MFIRFQAVAVVIGLGLLSNSAQAEEYRPKIFFSLSDGTAAPSNICIKRAFELVEELEGGSVNILKQRHALKLDPPKPPPREYISVTYGLPNEREARFYLNCYYGIPMTSAETNSGEICIELAYTKPSGDTEPGAQDSFSIRLADHDDYGGEAGLELYKRAVNTYREKYHPVQAALTNSCDDVSEFSSFRPR